LYDRPVRVAFLASSKKTKGYQKDPAFIYRCENLGHALHARSIEVELGHSRSWRFPHKIDCAVVHRPRASFAVWRLVRRLKSLGAKLVADVDDLIFDEGFARYNPMVRNGRRSLEQQQRLCREHRGAIKWFDHITVSTEALRDHAHRCFPGKPVTVLHNAVPWHWRRAPHPQPAQKTQRKTIVYLPGTPSHDRDFALLAGPLTHFLRAHPEVRLRVTGPLNFQLDVPAGQLEHCAKVPFASYVQQFEDAWVSLAPLEDTPFNACKSGLKALESGYWGVPAICSPNPDYARFEQAGALMATTGDDWVRWLELLLADDEYQRITDNLRMRTLRLGDVDMRANEFLDGVVARAVS